MPRRTHGPLAPQDASWEEPAPPGRALALAVAGVAGTAALLVGGLVLATGGPGGGAPDAAVMGATPELAAPVATLPTAERSDAPLDLSPVPLPLGDHGKPHPPHPTHPHSRPPDPAPEPEPELPTLPPVPIPTVAPTTAPAPTTASTTTTVAPTTTRVAPTTTAAASSTTSAPSGSAVPTTNTAPTTTTTGTAGTTTTTTTTTSTTVAEEPTLLTLLRSDPALSRFADLVEQGGVAASIEVEQAHTLLAPDDAAIAAYADTPEGAAELATPRSIRAFVLRHLLLAPVTADELLAAERVEAASGDWLEVDADARTVGGASIVTPDVIARNGVLHVLGAVAVGA